jgi:glucose/arabinose dehydrogenase
MRLAPVIAAALAVGVLTSVSGSALGAESAFRKVVVARGLEDPVQVTSTRSEPRRLYVVEQRGTVRVIERRKLRDGFFLDVRDRVIAGGEQGLLGLAFDPKYATNRFVYVNYTDTNGDTRVVRYRTDGRRALTSTARQLLFLDQPYSNHNGGNLVFGPDGGLYVGTGDGGAGGDPENRAQNMQSLLGKMLRLDVRHPGRAPEIVALGLRNPWRYSFDRLTHDLYIGDVGQSAVEEIDFTPSGSTGLLNYGWDVYEGSSRFEDKAPGPGRLVFPVYEYGHDDRGQCTVIGGFVYRGAARPAERGRYVFGDYCSGRVWSFRVKGGEATGVRTEPFRISSLSSFGEDVAGELYATSQDGGVVYRLS